MWRVLTDLDAFPSWNPLVVSASGELAPGALLELTLRPKDGRPTVFRPTITRVEPNRCLEWLGHLGPRGVFDRRHRLQIEPISGGARFGQSEEFTGLAAPLLLRLIGEKRERGSRR